MANYTVSDTEALVQELKEFEDELQTTTKKSKPKVRKIRTLAEILNQRPNAPKSEELAKNVMDLESIFDKVKSGPEKQSTGIKAKRSR